jgi:outer membrane receptor protein involved in Fe transport
LSWAPVESVRFRAQVSQAVRAPNVAELFAPGGENFAPVSDPCNGVTAATPGDIAANCRSIPEIAARIAATGSFTLTQTEIQGTGGFTSRGNPNLSPETSDSWSFGTVIDRDFGASGSWTLSVDYFTIEIEDLIDIVARQTSVSSCYNVPASTFPNQFCGLLVRDTTGPAFQLGELEEVNSGYINEGTLETEGIDLSLLFGFELGPGQASIRMNHTHLLDFTQTKFGAPDDLLGETGYAEDKSQLAFVYSPGRWNVEWEVSYMSDSVPDKSVPLFDFGVGDYVIHDFQVQYGFGEGNTRVYAGVNNAFDEEAPIILSGVPGNTTGTDTDATVYNPIGRAWYAGMRMSFGGSE